jgi:hypothetical protein
MNTPHEARTRPATRQARTWTTTIETSDTIVVVADDGAMVSAVRLACEWLVAAHEAEANQPWFSEWFYGRGLAKREVRYLTTRRMRYPPD